MSRIRIALIFSFLTCLSLFDVWEDHSEGVPLSHLSIELLTLIIVSISLLLLLLRIRKDSQRHESREKYLHDVQTEANAWKKAVAGFQEGIGQAITTQLDRWQLSPSEKDVALLLLKGFSTREIAQLRKTNEGTVRQQSASIYEKAKLKGRAELSAFFLEDLLQAESPTGDI